MKHDIRFVEMTGRADVGAWAWLECCDGMEFTPSPISRGRARLQSLSARQLGRSGWLYVQAWTAVRFDFTSARTARKRPMATFLRRQSIRASTGQGATRHPAAALPRCGEGVQGGSSLGPKRDDKDNGTSCRAAYDASSSLPRVQPARRTRRDLRDGAAELHPARARAGESVLQGVAHDGRRRGVMRLSSRNSRSEYPGPRVAHSSVATGSRLSALRAPAGMTRGAQP